VTTRPVLSAGAEAIEADVKELGLAASIGLPDLLIYQPTNDLGKADAFSLCPIGEVTVVRLIEVKLSPVSGD
jgi:hypothetical protein